MVSTFRGSTVSVMCLFAGFNSQFSSSGKGFYETHPPHMHPVGIPPYHYPGPQAAHAPGPAPSHPPTRPNPLRLSKESSAPPPPSSSSSARPPQKSRDQAGRSHDTHVTPSLSADPFLPPMQSRQSRDEWCTFGEPLTISTETTAAEVSPPPPQAQVPPRNAVSVPPASVPPASVPSATRVSVPSAEVSVPSASAVSVSSVLLAEVPLSSTASKLPLKRHASLGAFSDDFITSHLSREASTHSLFTPPPAVPRPHPALSHASSSSRLGGRASGGGSEPRLSPLERHRRLVGRSVEVMGSATSEGDLKDFQYRRLIHSPNVGSSQDISPSAVRRRGGDLERLLQPSSPEPENTTEITGQAMMMMPATGRGQERWRKRAGLVHGSGGVAARRTLSASDGEGLRQREAEPAVSGASLERLGNLSSDIFQHIPILRNQSWMAGSGGVANAGLGERPHDDSHMTGSSPPSSGLEACLMSTEPSGTTQTTPRSPDLLTTPPDQKGVVTAHDRKHSVETGLSVGVAAPIKDDNLYLLPLENQRSTDQDPDRTTTLSPSPPPPDNLVFPQALDSQSNLLEVLDSAGGQGEISPEPQLAVEDLTPKEERSPQDRGGVVSDAPVDISTWMQSVARATNETASSPHETSEHGDDGAIAEGGGANVPRNYDIMSPIPEASQELTSSMSQPNNRHSGTHFPSPPAGPAPLPDLTSATAAARQHSVSPFRHAALDHAPSKTTPTPAEGGNTSRQGMATRSGSGLGVARNALQPRGISSNEGATATSVDHVTAGSSHDRHVTDHMTSSVNTSVSSRPTTNGPPREQSGRGHHASAPRGISTSPSHVGVAGPSQDGTRPLSPLATFSLQPSEARPPQDASHLHPRESGQQSQPQLKGSGQQAVQTHPQERGAGSQLRHHTPHSRQEVGSRVQHRISQDLEMMNLAISGMDSSHSGSSGGSGLSCSQPLYAQQAIQGRSEVSRSNGSTSRGNQRSDQTTPSSQPMSRPQHAPRPPSGQAVHTAGGVSGTVAPGNTFRPITPAILTGLQQQRPGSAPNTVGDSVATPLSLAVSHARPTSSSMTSQQPQGRDHRHFSHSTGHAHGNLVATARGMGGDGRQFSHSAGNQGRGQQSYQPPQVTADSYDYLPPYSPPVSQSSQPHPQPHPQHSSQPHPQQQRGGGALPRGGSYMDPPPSYDEIFGETLPPSGGQRSTSRREGAEPPRDPPTNSRHRQRRSRDQPRSQSSQSDHRNHHHHHQSSQSDKSRNLGPLSSLTNLFRRGRKHSRPDSDLHAVTNTTDGGVGTADDYTAQWVESYSHTPRPHSAAMSHAPSPSSIRSAANLTPSSPRFAGGGSHTPPLTDMPMRSPVPYRPPPPLTLPENVRQIDSRPLTPAQGRGVGVPLRTSQPNLNLSMSRLPTENGSRPSQGQRSSRDRDRPRPVSAYLPLESVTSINNNNGVARGNLVSLRQPGHAPTVPTPLLLAGHTPPRPHVVQQARNMSSSCSNIATTQLKRHKNPARSSLRQKGSGRGFLSLDQQGVNQVGGNEGASSLPGSSRDVLADDRVGATPIDRQPSRGGVSHAPSTASGAGPVNGETSSLVANGNANNTNASAVSSPRASAVSSPINLVTPTPPENQAASNASSRVNVSALSGSSALSQPMQQEGLEFTPNSALSRVRSSTNSESSASVSSRTAARLRAEARRESLTSAQTSSDEEGLTCHSHPRTRPKRQRSRGQLGQMQDHTPSSPPTLNADVTLVEGEEGELAQTLRPIEATPPVVGVVSAEVGEGEAEGVVVSEQVLESERTISPREIAGK